MGTAASEQGQANKMSVYIGLIILGIVILVGFSCRFTFWRLPTGGVAVLIYHRIADNDGKPEKLKLTPAKFKRQMDYLYRHGYQTISPGDLFAFIKGEKGLLKRAIMLCFDDGYKDIYLNAYPILHRYGFTATTFPVSQFVGGTKEWDETEASKPWEKLLSWEEIEEMSQYGITFGSHSHTHAWLTLLSDEELHRELRQSKAILESRLNRPVDFFCYPYGKLDERVKEAVKKAGYLAAFSGQPGKNRGGEDLFELRRVLIRGYDTPLDWILNLRNGQSRLF